MLFRSTGLGKTELVGQIAGVTRQGDYLILQVDTLEPVRWRIRAGINLRDMRMLIKAIIKLSVFAFLVCPWHWIKKAEHPGDF
jgi:hypothetical protein